MIFEYYKMLGCYRWRVLRGILPDYATLKHRHIKQLARCDLCYAMEEELHHALVTCSHAQNYWRSARELLELKLPALHPYTWAKDITLDGMFSDEERSKITTIMHSIWNARNRWTHDQESFDPNHIVRKVREDLS